MTQCVQAGSRCGFPLQVNADDVELTGIGVFGGRGQYKANIALYEGMAISGIPLTESLVTWTCFNSAMTDVCLGPWCRPVFSLGDAYAHAPNHCLPTTGAVRTSVPLNQQQAVLAGLAHDDTTAKLRSLLVFV